MLGWSKFQREEEIKKELRKVKDEFPMVALHGRVQSFIKIEELAKTRALHRLAYESHLDDLINSGSNDYGVREITLADVDKKGKTVEVKHLIWRSNNSPVPPSWFFEHGYECFMPEGQQAAHDKSLDRAAEEYRKNQAARTPEQIAEHQAELDAAFGPGKTIVDVMTGDTYTTKTPSIRGGK